MYPLPRRVKIGSPWHAPREGGKRRHKGVDLFMPRGTPVYAVVPGTITQAKYANDSAGNRVRVTSGGQAFNYYHLDQVHVKPGQQVKPGDIVGTVGDSGNAKGTSTHVHFEQMVNGVRINPTKFLETGEVVPDYGYQKNAAVTPTMTYPNLPVATWIRPKLWWERPLPHDQLTQQRVAILEVQERLQSEMGGTGTIDPAIGGPAGTRDIRDTITKAAIRGGITDPKEHEALIELWSRESSLIPGNRNPRSSAAGLPQLLKMNYHYFPNGEASIGNAWEESVGGVNYINARYGGSPIKALAKWDYEKRYGTKGGWY